MRIALASSVRNEQASIGQHIDCHRYLGVTDFLVFLDRSTDGTRDLLRTLPEVMIFEELSFADLEPSLPQDPELDRFSIRRLFPIHLGLQQVCYANRVLSWCREHGIDWLLFVDQDELICLDREKVERDALPGFLECLDRSVGQLASIHARPFPFKWRGARFSATAFSINPCSTQRPSVYQKP